VDLSFPGSLTKGRTGFSNVLSVGLAPYDLDRLKVQLLNRHCSSMGHPVIAWGSRRLTLSDSRRSFNAAPRHLVSYRMRHQVIWCSAWGSHPTSRSNQGAGAC
jgi:hypothetical protein